MQLARLFVALAALQRDAQGDAAPAAKAAKAAGAAGDEAVVVEMPATSQCTCTAGQPEARQTMLPHSTTAALDQVDLGQLPRLQGAHLLELGAGTGVAGITAAGCGAHVTLSDLPAVLPLLQANIERNKQLIAAAGGSARAAELDWDANADVQLWWAQQEQQRCSEGCTASCSSHIVKAPAPAGDTWGFGADLVFNAGQINALVRVVSGLVKSTCSSSVDSSCQSRCSCFVLAHKQRHPDVDAKLLEAFAVAGCKVRQIVVCEQIAVAGRICFWLVEAA